MDKKSKQIVARELVKVAKDLVAVDFETLEEAAAFTASIAKAFTKKKRELGIKAVRQNYKGTGSKKANRQLNVRFQNGAFIDLWVSPKMIQYGGVAWINAKGERVRPSPSKQRIDTTNVNKIADQMADTLSNWVEGD